MNKKIQVEINKRAPKGIVNFLGNVQNKVGTYDSEKIEYFKKKLVEKGLLVGKKILFVVDKMDEVSSELIDSFFDKIVDNSVKLRMKKELEAKGERQNESEEISINLSDYSDEIDEVKPISTIVPARHINFDDLEPLGQVIFDEYDIDELKEIKMKILLKEQEDKDFNESGGIRKK